MMLLISRMASGPLWARLLIALVVLLLIAGSILFFISVGSVDAREKGEPSKGLAAAQRWCSQCHLVTVKGRRATDATPSFHELARNKAMTRKRLYAILSNPHEMPTGQLSRADIDNIIAYIESLRSRLR
jgi:mono/diheme cytochrome c family protein